MEQLLLFKPENNHAARDYAPVDYSTTVAQTSQLKRANSHSADRDSDCTVQSLPLFHEFFAGSGLVAEGLKKHFRTSWANDISAKKAAVYSANHDASNFHLGSITEVLGESLPTATMSWASFPCQDLSLAGLSGGINAARSGLVWEWLRIIDELKVRPPILVAENVLGLVSSDSGRNYQALHEALVDRGYVVGAMLIDAERFVPQSRPRIFVVAALAPLNLPNELISMAPNWLHPETVCKAARELNGWVWWRLPEPPKRTQHLSDIIEWDAPFASSASDALNVSLIGSKHRKALDVIPKSQTFAAPGYKRTRNGSQVLELRFDDVSGCLRTPGGGSSRQVIVIKRDGAINSRLLTVREAARLMGAPENYVIPGSYNDGYMAMGDAVAVPVVRWLAEHLLLPLVRAYEKR